MSWWWLLIVPAYVLGVFPSALLVGRLTGHDPTREGSGNPGASNVYRVAGRRAGAATLVADIAKGAVPSAVGLMADGRALGLACGIAAMAGHVFPVTRGLRGGKGVATAGGMSIVIYPLVSLALLGVWLVAIAISRRASIASLVLCVALPVGVALGGRPWAEVATTACVGIVVVVRHRDNIRRLLRRQEDSLPSVRGVRSD